MAVTININGFDVNLADIVSAMDAADIKTAAEILDNGKIEAFVRAIPVGYRNAKQAKDIWGDSWHSATALLTHDTFAARQRMAKYGIRTRSDDRGEWWICENDPSRKRFISNEVTVIWREL